MVSTIIGVLIWSYRTDTKVTLNIRNFSVIHNHTLVRRDSSLKTLIVNSDLLMDYVCKYEARPGVQIFIQNRPDNCPMGSLNNITTNEFFYVDDNTYFLIDE